MTIRMEHPKHGVIHATGSEVAWNEANGWKVAPKVKPVETPVEPVHEPIAEVAPPEVPAPDVGLAGDLRTQYIAKFGKPPHHRMREETIRAALAEN